MKQRASVNAPGKALGFVAGAPLLFATVAAVGSCSDHEPVVGAGHAGGAATAGPTGSSSASSAAAGATGGDAGSDPDAAPCTASPDDVWSPETDSCWETVGWDALCLTEMALQPKLAVPPLEWEPCPWTETPGCQQLVVKWTPAGPNAASGMPSVIRHGQGYRVGLLLGWKDSDGQNRNRMAVFDSDGAPTAVWRVSPQTYEHCALTGPEVTSSRVWLGRVDIPEQGAVQAAYVAPTYDELSSVQAVLPIAVGNQGRQASDDTLALWGLAGNTVTIYDRLSNTATTFGGASLELKQAFPVAESALMGCYLQPGAYDAPSACIWNRSTQAVDVLLAAGATSIFPDVKSDGNTLVWVQASPDKQRDGSWLGDIWTSPFATSTAAIVPTKRRAAPKMSIPRSRAGEGFYAVSGFFDGLTHIYRVSDMHHWSFPTPPEIFPWVAYVDSEEIWFRRAGGLFRQRIDTLGPGDPAP